MDERIKGKEEHLQKTRENQKHLESFRFVLFNKVQVLEDEKGPLEDQALSLQESIKDLYAEFVSEFQQKQQLDLKLADRSTKVSMLANENQDLRSRRSLLAKDMQNLFSAFQEIVNSSVGDQLIVERI